MTRSATIATFSLLIIAILPQLAFSAPKTLTIHDFILSADMDPAVERHKDQILNFENAPKDTPYIERVELRVGLDELDTDKQSYQLRFTPRGWGETSANRNLTRTVAEIDDIEKALYLSNALKQRYDMVLTHLETAFLLKTYKELEIVYLDRVNVLQQISATEIDSNVSALISAEDKLMELRLDILDLKNKLADLEATIRKSAGGRTEIEFNKDSLIELSKINEILKDIPPSPETANIALKHRQAEIQLDREELELEKSQNLDYISFFQVSYETDEDEDEWQKKTSFEIGIKLPFITSGKEEIWRRKSELNRDKFGYEQDKQETLEDIAQLRRTIQHQLDQHGMLMKRWQKGNVQNTLKHHLAMEGSDPLDLLKLKESLLQLDISINQLSFSIRANFIELLNQSGRLFQKPLTDYLSNRLEPLS